jgi:hypothetical protein
MARTLFVFSLIVAAALSRIIPHPANVAPITALALFSGAYLDKKTAVLVSLAAMLLSDYFIGFYSGMLWVYGSFFAIGLIGLWLRKHKSPVSIMGASIVGSVMFFVVTNFGVWLGSQVTYQHTLAGLALCYTAAIPFFRNTLIGDLAYVGAMFGAFELAQKMVPALKMQTEG